MVPADVDAEQLDATRLVLRAPLPKLIPSEAQYETISMISDQSEAVIALSVVIPFFVQFALKGFMSKLWLWMDMMQIFTGLTFYDVDVPENVIMI